MLAVENLKCKCLEIAAVCQRSVSHAHVTATIRDFEAMDKSLLNQSAAQRGSPLFQTPAAGQGRELPSGAARRRPAWDVALAQSDSPAVASDLIHAERQRQQENRLAEAEQLLQRGVTAEQLGKVGVARIYCQMAARRANGELKENAQARLTLIGRPRSASGPAKDGGANIPR